MPTLDLPGVALNYSIDGPASAPVLVLSNSLGSALQMWQPQVAALSAHYRLLRYDTRGHGASSVPPAPYALVDLGRDVLALLDALDVECAHFCGISMGGLTGMWLGARAARRIGRLVLCDTAPWLGPPDVLNARIETVRREGMEPLADTTMARWFTPDYGAAHPDVVARTRAAFVATSVEGYTGCCAALRDADERDELARIKARTLVIGGMHDPAPTLAASRELADSITGAEFAALPTAHLSNLGAAAQFNARVLDFLAKD